LSEVNIFIMREILFKAKEFNGGEWVESMTLAYGTIKRKRDWLFMQVGDVVYRQIDPKTVCQFINRKDDKKVKIFESDKVQINYGRHSLEKKGLTRTGVVIYEDCSFMVKIDNSEVRVPFSIISKIEIIGNIHD